MAAPFPLQIEGLAAKVQRQAKVSAGAIDAYELCAAAGLRVVLGDPGERAALVGPLVFVDPEDSLARQRSAAANRLAYALLDGYGMSTANWACDWLACALVLPRKWFERRIEAHGGRIEPLAWELGQFTRETLLERVDQLAILGYRPAAKRPSARRLAA